MRCLRVVRSRKRRIRYSSRSRKSPKRGAIELDGDGSLQCLDDMADSDKMLKRFPENEALLEDRSRLDWEIARSLSMPHNAFKVDEDALVILGGSEKASTRRDGARYALRTALRAHESVN